MQFRVLYRPESRPNIKNAALKYLSSLELDIKNQISAQIQCQNILNMTLYGFQL